MKALNLMTAIARKQERDADIARDRAAQVEVLDAIDSGNTVVLTVLESLPRALRGQVQPLIDAVAGMHIPAPNLGPILSAIQELDATLAKQDAAISVLSSRIESLERKRDYEFTIKRNQYGGIAKVIATAKRD
jgi:hypothetical protein